jgi:hypothetical protein
MKETCHIHLKKYFLCDIRSLDGYEYKIEIGTLPNGDKKSYPKMHTIGTFRLTLTSHTHDDAQ